MSLGILGSALSGLSASQRSLETASNNIANVNTEGYSRQRVELANLPEQLTPAGYLGTGVNAVNIARSYDQFITGQLRSSTTAFSELDVYHSLAAHVDNLLADQETGLSASMKNFFNSVNDVANDPASIPNRKILLSEVDALADHFATIGNRLDDLKQQVNSNLQAGIDEVNKYAQSIAKLNLQIVDAIGRSRGQQMPNELMDQRDELLKKIAAKVDVSVVNQSNGAVSVFIGQGQSLVLGAEVSALSLSANASDPTHMEIAMNGTEISRQISGGEFSGLMRFRDEVLYPAQRQLGTLALGFATEVNKLHEAGYDLHNTTGNPLFDFGSPAVQVLSRANNVVLSAQFQAPPTSVANPSEKLGTSYRIDVTASGLDLTDLSGNNVTASYATLADLNTAASELGFSLTVMSGSFSVGDSFQVSPAINVATTIKRDASIANPQDIAAAQATGLPGDNRQAMELAKLETATKMQNSKATFNQVYGQLVSDVGGMTSTALFGRSAQETLLQEATKTKENLSGVNLDEEAANLIKYQNSYQAAAQAVSVARSLFDTLIGAVR